MSDLVDPAKRNQMMSGVRVAGTQPELVVRRFLHHRGFRYRLNVANLPGRPDLVLPKHKAAIFVNGCFWHAHAGCHLFRLPKSRREFWQQKLMSNRARDTRNYSELSGQGRRVATVWECATRGNQPDLGALVDWLVSNHHVLDLGDQFTPTGKGPLA